jgi:hypothetical protein
MEEKDFFIIDAFVNSENMQLTKINIWDRVSGAMWLQWKIVL